VNLSLPNGPADFCRSGVASRHRNSDEDQHGARFGCAMGVYRSQSAAALAPIPLGTFRQRRFSGLS
jgi:hypothetical protein